MAPKKASSTVVVTAEDRIAVALERIAIVVERLVDEGPPVESEPAPGPAYEPPSAKEKVGTLAEETAKLHKVVEEQKPAKPEPPKADAASALLGEEPEPPKGRTATFDEARKALLGASAKGAANDKLLAIMKETLGVERLSLIPKDQTGKFGAFITAIEAAGYSNPNR